MTSRFTEIVVDSRDPRRLAKFWCDVLGYRVIDEEEGVVEIASSDPAADTTRPESVPPSIVFIVVPESKTVKNRLHIDVSPIDSTQEAEVERLLALGARRIDIGQGEGRSWVVLSDPEGNEFCVLRALAP